MSTTVPREKVVTIVENFQELIQLRNRQMATSAQMIRWCVQVLHIDPLIYKMRGHETYQQRAQQQADNRRDKALAIIYLDWLATMFEDMDAAVDLSRGQSNL